MGESPGAVAIRGAGGSGLGPDRLKAGSLQFRREDAAQGALNDRGPHVVDAYQTLALLAKLEGRTADVRRLFERSFDLMPNRVLTLRELYDIDFWPYPIEQSQRTLATVAPLRPMTTASGWGLPISLSEQENSTRPNGCSPPASRPDPTTRSSGEPRLDLAVARNDVDSAREALGHLADQPFSPVEVERLRAWRGAQRGSPGRIGGPGILADHRSEG